MKTFECRWRVPDGDHAFALVPVSGTRGRPYAFGEPGETRSAEVADFLMAVVPATQALWAHVMDDAPDPSVHRGPNLPLENVSWNEVVRPGGFLDRLNAGPIRRVMAERSAMRDGVFRLPSETEWEYAARGGRRWTDGFRFSGSDDADAVAWYDRRHGDHTQPVGRKAPNQLGIFDMSGNVWEWCGDVFTPRVDLIPTNGAAFAGPGDERVLRGGCFHNWAMHCTVSKRYAMASDYHDGCIGFRVVFADQADRDVVRTDGGERT